MKIHTVGSAAVVTTEGLLADSFQGTADAEIPPTSAFPCVCADHMGSPACGKIRLTAWDKKKEGKPRMSATAPSTESNCGGWQLRVSTGAAKVGGGTHTAPPLRMQVLPF